MAFYGLIIIFTILIVMLYLSAFFIEMKYENAIALIFAKSSSAIGTMAYINAADLRNSGTAYINYTLQTDVK